MTLCIFTHVRHLVEFLQETVPKKMKTLNKHLKMQFSTFTYFSTHFGLKKPKPTKHKPTTKIPIGFYLNK